MWVPAVANGHKPAMGDYETWFRFANIGTQNYDPKWRVYKSNVNKGGIVSEHQPINDIKNITLSKAGWLRFDIVFFFYFCS